jgi:hypothetical protein
MDERCCFRMNRIAIRTRYVQSPEPSNWQAYLKGDRDCIILAILKKLSLRKHPASRTVLSAGVAGCGYRMLSENQMLSRRIKSNPRRVEHFDDRHIVDDRFPATFVSSRTRSFFTTMRFPVIAGEPVDGCYTLSQPSYFFRQRKHVTLSA